VRILKELKALLCVGEGLGKDTGLTTRHYNGGEKNAEREEKSSGGLGESARIGAGYVRNVSARAIHSQWKCSER
jgi:hypothetical protein